ncbi:MAG: aminotransferase class IV [Desulfobacteraceae bacterium]|jgi:branched-chain amino acid aminotransferase
MLTNRKVWTNSGFVPWEEATVHLMSHSVGRGSTIFEVLSVHATQKGTAIFRLDQHVQRFFRSAESLQMMLPLDQLTLTQAICQTVALNDVRQGLVKVMGIYPDPEFGILPPAGPIEVVIFAIDPNEDLGGVNFPFDTGTTACIASLRKLDPSTIPIQAKAAANYLNGMIARQEARDRGFETALLLDTQGFIAEGPTESVFLVCDDEIFTPVLGTILDSITRRSILTIATDMGMQVHQQRLPKSLLYKADEIFMSGTPNKILPVRTIEDRQMPQIPGPVVKRLSKSMAEITSGHHSLYQNWLFPVLDG